MYVTTFSLCISGMRSLTHTHSHYMLFLCHRTKRSGRSVAVETMTMTGGRQRRARPPPHVIAPPPRLPHWAPAMRLRLRAAAARAVLVARTHRARLPVAAAMGPVAAVQAHLARTRPAARAFWRGSSRRRYLPIFSLHSCTLSLHPNFTM